MRPKPIDLTPLVIFLVIVVVYAIAAFLWRCQQLAPIERLFTRGC